MSAARSQSPPLPLEGFTVGITADRRREELTSMLCKRGARVVAAPTIRIERQVGDSELLAATEACLAAPPDIVVVTTGIGFRGWMEAADGWGLGESLRRHLGNSELVARGPKARGAIRSAGLVEAWSPASESIGEVLDRLLSNDLDGRRIAVQRHGDSMDQEVEALRGAGADVLAISVYRWVPSDDESVVIRLVQGVVSGQVDALLFTSAPAANGLLEVAEGAGLRESLLATLRKGPVVACVGPICAQPMVAQGVPVVVPERARLGAIVRAVTEEVPVRRTERVQVAGRCLELRGHAVVVDGSLVYLPPAPMAMLRALAGRPGGVFTRKELAGHLPGEQSGAHAVEMAVARLRSLLKDPKLVRTVVKRGYRLACDDVDRSS